MEQKQVPPPETEFPISNPSSISNISDEINLLPISTHSTEEQEHEQQQQENQRNSSVHAEYLATAIKRRQEKQRLDKQEELEREILQQALRQHQQEQQQQQQKQQRQEQHARRRHHHHQQLLQHQRHNSSSSGSGSSNNILEDRQRIFANRGDRYEDYDDERSVEEILNAAIASTGGAAGVEPILGPGPGLGLGLGLGLGRSLLSGRSVSVPIAMQGNGAAAAGAAAMAVPTPAGHQNELNLIYGMVEELSRQLADNRRATEDIVSGLGRLRNRARDRNLSNDDILGEASEEIFAQEPNLEALLSILTESLDRAKVSRDSNFSLLSNYARVLASILGQFHIYKQRHVADVSAWHRSYRAQLAEARAENERLREQIWDMQEHAGHANAMLREFRRKFDGEVDVHHEDEDDDDDDEKDGGDGGGGEKEKDKKQQQQQQQKKKKTPSYWVRRVDDRARRQELRFWKRMAMPHIPDDDPIWSDDDDLIDPAEKERQLEMERKVAEQALAGVLVGSSGEEHGGDGVDSDGEGEGSVIDHHSSGVGVALGGVAMERDSSSASLRELIPTPPPRPASTGSTGGRTG